MRLLSALLSLLCSPLLLYGMEIKACFYTDFIPVSYLNRSTNSPSGYELDLLQAMAVYGGFNLTFIPIQDYSPLWTRPKEHICDVAAGGISRTPEREADGIEFTDPHWIHGMPQSLLVLKATYDAGFRGYSDLRPGDKLGVVNGTTGKLRCADRVVEEAHMDPTAVLVDFPEEQSLLAALQRGDIVGIARGQPGNAHQESLHPELYKTTALRSFSEAFSFAIPRGCPSIRMVMNDALERVTMRQQLSYVEWTRDHTIFHRTALATAS